MNRGDSEAYLAKKQFYDTLLTIYGRKPVLEALQLSGIRVHRLHVAESNKPAGILTEIHQLASQHGAEICHHSRSALSHISKNSKQDQGVAVDLICPGFTTFDQFLDSADQPQSDLLALDGITNPQNLGMIIRSACAGNISGILLPAKGCAQIDPLVIKASAGTVFRAPIIRISGSLEDALGRFKQRGYAVVGLSSHAQRTLGDCPHGKQVFVLGNETKGVSKTVETQCDRWVKIPMNNGVESLNVAVTAALIAFRRH